SQHRAVRACRARRKPRAGRQLHDSPRRLRRGAGRAAALARARRLDRWSPRRARAGRGGRSRNTGREGSRGTASTRCRRNSLRSCMTLHGRGILITRPREQAQGLAKLVEAAGGRIVILRGEGGRSLLGDTLAARGAQVEYAECYRRVRPQTDSGPLLTAFAKGAVHAVTVSSAEGLENLLEMLGAAGRKHLKKTPLFVPHPRIAAEAKRLGLGEASVGGASDQEMLERLVAYFRHAK